MATTESLIALYTAMGGASWTVRTNWLTGDPCSGWHGIMCSGGAVIGLDLHSNNLQGAVPTEVGRLTSVRYSLDLYGNYINGHLPTEVGLLTNLGAVDVHRNALSGTVPTEVGQLHAKLATFLYLHENPKVSGTLPTQLARLTRLPSLFLSSSKLSGTLATTLGELRSLSSMALNGNSLSGTVPTQSSPATSAASTLRLD